MSEQLWAASPERILASNIDRFRRSVNAAAGLDLADTRELHGWSITDPASFWSAVWDDVGMIGEKGETSLITGDHMWEARFFPDARINLAENLLDGRGIEAHQPALSTSAKTTSNESSPGQSCVSRWRRLHRL